MSVRILFPFFALCITACGQDQNGPSVNEAPMGFNFDIKTRWQAEKASCGEMSLTSNRFYVNHFIRVESEETNEKSCSIAYVFDRIISEVLQSGSNLREHGILRGSIAKRKCSDKHSVSYSTTEEVISFGPEEFDYTFSTDSNQILMSVYKGPNCARGELKLDLVPITQ